jgi:hypothetical protein
MTRGIPSHPVLAAMLALALLVGLALPASAAPTTVVGTGDSVTVTESLAAIDGPGHHFGFSQASVLAQATNNFTPPSGPVTPQVPNQVCNPSCTFGGGAPQSETASATHVASSVVAASTTSAAGIGTYAQTPSLFAFTNAAVAQPERLTNPGCNQITGPGQPITCSGTAVGDVIAAPNAIVISYCGTPGAVAPVGLCPNQINQVPTTITVTPATNASPTAATALPVLQAGGFIAQANNQCARFVGQNCPVSGAVTGSSTITSSATWNLQVAAAPAGALAGVAPVAFVLTTTNPVAPGEGPFPCAVLPAVGGATTCNFVSVGNPLVGLTVAVCFATAAAPVCVFGTVAPAAGGAGAPLILPNLPILPPPPLEFIPPPPPPLLPPPPPAPTGAMAAPRAAFPEVPVIPEADSLFLVIGGLVALGGLVGYRSLRRRRDDDIA